MDEVADRLHAGQPGRRAAEAVPGERQQLAVDLAIAAGQQELQGRERQLGRIVLARIGVDLVELAGVADQRVVGEPHRVHANGHIDPAAMVAEAVDVLLRLEPAAHRSFSGASRSLRRDGCTRSR